MTDDELRKMADALLCTVGAAMGTVAMEELGMSAIDMLNRLLRLHVQILINPEVFDAIREAVDGKEAFLEREYNGDFDAYVRDFTAKVRALEGALSGKVSGSA